MGKHLQTDCEVEKSTKDDHGVLMDAMAFAPPEAGSTYPTLEIDYALYEEVLETSDLTEDQKRDFLDCLWVIIVSFVDLGFGVHPVQQATDGNTELLAHQKSACGQNPEILVQKTSERPDMIESEKALHNTGKETL